MPRILSHSLTIPRTNRSIHNNRSGHQRRSVIGPRVTVHWEDLKDQPKERKAMGSSLASSSSTAASSMSSQTIETMETRERTSSYMDEFCCDIVESQGEWGHFIDVSEAEEELTRSSKILSGRCSVR